MTAKVCGFKYLKVYTVEFFERENNFHTVYTISKTFKVRRALTSSTIYLISAHFLPIRFSTKSRTTVCKFQ